MTDCDCCPRCGGSRVARVDHELMMCRELRCGWMFDPEMTEKDHQDQKADEEYNLKNGG